MSTAARFRAAYTEHRAVEGRGAGGLEELLALPFVQHGPFARQWSVRARTFVRFVRAVVEPQELSATPRPLRVLDLGAGNGWLCYQLTQRGHACVALDWRRDTVDGLGAATPYLDHLSGGFGRVVATFEAVPLRPTFDIAVFNAAIHYATSLEDTIAEAVRVTRPGGRVVILDSPFYAETSDGEQMVAEKRTAAQQAWGARADALLALPVIEYLTSERLARASAPHALAWRRHRVSYPLWYEVRPIVARLRGRRRPSRFDVWDAMVGSS